MALVTNFDQVKQVKENSFYHDILKSWKRYDDMMFTLQNKASCEAITLEQPPKTVHTSDLPAGLDCYQKCGILKKQCGILRKPPNPKTRAN